MKLQELSVAKLQRNFYF